MPPVPGPSHPRLTSTASSSGTSSASSRPAPAGGASRRGSNHPYLPTPPSTQQSDSQSDNIQQRPGRHSIDSGYGRSDPGSSPAVDKGNKRPRAASPVSPRHDRRSEPRTSRTLSSDDGTLRSGTPTVVESSVGRASSRTMDGSATPEMGARLHSLDLDPDQRQPSQPMSDNWDDQVDAEDGEDDMVTLSRLAKGTGRASTPRTQSSIGSGTLMSSVPDLTRSRSDTSSDRCPSTPSASGSGLVRAHSGQGYDPKWDPLGYGPEFCIYPLKSIQSFLNVSNIVCALGDLTLPPWMTIDGPYNPAGRKSSKFVYVILEFWEQSGGEEGSHSWYGREVLRQTYLIRRKTPIKQMAKDFWAVIFPDRGVDAMRVDYDGERLHLHQAIQDLEQSEFECGDTLGLGEDQSCGGFCTS